MTRRRLYRIAGIFLLCLLAFGLFDHRGSADVNEEERKLEAFVMAAAAVDDVMATWQPKIVRADDRRAKGLREQANLEIRDSIEKVEGISFAEYREIHHAIAGDPEMLARVEAIIQRQTRR